MKTIKSILLLIIYLIVNDTTIAQDYRDAFIGEYVCERAEDDGLGNIDWANLSVRVEKSTSDIFQIIITDSTIINGGSPHCVATIDTNGHFFVLDEYYYVGDFYTSLDSLYMYRSAGSGLGGGYTYYGKKNTTSINHPYLPKLIRTFPNPVENMLFVKFQGNKKAEYSIYNLKGESLASGSFTSEKQIDVSGFPQGIYLLKVILDGGVYSEKIVVK